jgi:hypothetical protein
VDEGDKANVAYSFFDELLGATDVRSNSIELGLLDLPRWNPDHLCHHFSKDEVRSVIRSLPSDKALGPDGFMT